MADLRSIAQELYARPLSEFIAARKEAADGAGSKELAKQVKELRKPSAAAWAVNALARERAELVEEVVELGEQLRDAQTDTDGSRTRLLDRARRDLTRQAIDEASDLVKASGGTLSAQAAAGVEETLRAAMTDPDAANAVQDGLLVTTFAANPFEPVDLTDVVAIPPEGARPRTKKVKGTDAAGAQAARGGRSHGGEGAPHGQSCGRRARVTGRGARRGPGRARRAAQEGQGDRPGDRRDRKSPGSGGHGGRPG